MSKSKKSKYFTIIFCLSVILALGGVSVSKSQSVLSLFNQKKPNIQLPNIPIPIVVEGNLKSKHMVSLIWSSQCVKCRALLRGDLWEVYSRAYSKQDIAFLFLEYEDSPEIIKNTVVPAMCNGRPFYGYWTISNVLAGTTVKSASSNSFISGKIQDVCGDDHIMPNTIATESFKSLKKTWPNASTSDPIVIVDGIIVTDYKSIHGKLQ